MSRTKKLERKLPKRGCAPVPPSLSSHSLTHTLTGRDDDYPAKEAYLSVGKLEPVDPLREVKDGVHQRLGVARRHLVDGVFANDVAV